MAVTIATLGERVLRRLGVAVVAASERPGAGATVPVSTIAARALQAVGVNPVANAERPAADTVPVAANEIARQVLERLGVIGSDEIPYGPDLDDAYKKTVAVHEALNALGIVDWTLDAVPAKAAQHYVIMAAQLAGPGFGRPSDMTLYAAAQEVLRLEALSGARGQGLAEEKVRAAHDALLGQGVASWGADAIPLAVAEEYVALAANGLAPALGKPAGDPAPIEARVRRYALVLKGPAIAQQALLDTHAMLDARGRVRWGWADLPDYAEGPYVMLAANIAAPAFGLPQDVNADMRALRELTQVTALGSNGGRVMADYF